MHKPVQTNKNSTKSFHLVWSDEDWHVLDSKVKSQPCNKEKKKQWKVQFEIYLQWPHCTVNCHQHRRSSGRCAIMCKSRATHPALITSNMLCNMCYEGTTHLLSLTELKCRAWNCSWKNKREFLGGSRGMVPRKSLKVETKICAIWSILEANLKKSSTLMFMMNISFVLWICIHRSTIFIFI